MPIPDFQSVMLPLLKELADGREWTIRELTAALADRFELTDDERAELLPSGQQAVFNNRVAWAKTYMKAAGLIEQPGRGRVTITAAGHSVLTENLTSLNMRALERFPGFTEFRQRSTQPTPADKSPPIPQTIEDATPIEQIEAAEKAIRENVKESILERLRECSPAKFERVVMKLLLALGYGVSGEGRVTGKPGDGGIDGMIWEDKLGLDVVCLQAKRWENNVGRDKVQQFVGSMDFVRATKGVILTTSSFSREAKDFVDRIQGKKVVLVDGNTLADLMYSHNVGVAIAQAYEVKEISNDFFSEDDE